MVEGMDKEGMRFNVMEANLMVSTAAASFGYDVLDLHYMLMHQVDTFKSSVCCLLFWLFQVHKRMPDGIHWTQAAVRFQMNLILTHFCLSRNISLPRRDSSNFLRHAKRIADCALEGPVEFVKDRNENNVYNNKRKPDSSELLNKKRRIFWAENKRLREAFKKKKKCNICYTWGGGSGPTKCYTFQSCV